MTPELARGAAWRWWAAIALAVVVAACAPLSQRAGSPEAGFSGPRLERQALISFDGAALPLTVWRAQDEAGAEVEPWAVIVALHGMNDYAANFAMAGPWWARRGITTYAYDQRGFGRTPSRGVWGGEALYDRDLRTMLALVRAEHPHAVLAVVGESMGAATAVSALADPEAPTPDRVVLVSPAVWGWSAQPVHYRLALWLAAHVRPSWRIGTPGRLTRNIKTSDNDEMLQARLQDPLMIVSTRVDSLYGVTNLMEQARERIGQVRAPVLYLHGAHDQLIPIRAAATAAARLKPGDRTACYSDGWHLLTRDRQAEVVWKDIEAYLRDPKAPLPSAAAPLTGEGGCARRP